MCRAVLAFGVVLIAALATAAVFRCEIAAAALKRALDDAGFPDASLRVERLDLHGMSVAEIEAGSALRVERAEAVFDLGRLPAVPLERLRLTGARVDLGALPEAESAEGAPGSGFPLALLPALELEDAVVLAPSALGPLRIRLDSRVTPEDGALRMTLEGEVDSETGAADLRIAARRADDGGFEATAAVSALRVSDPRVRVAAGSASLTVAGESSGLRLGAASGEATLSLEGVVAGETEVGAVTARVPFALETGDGAGSGTLRLSKAGVRLGGLGLELASVEGTISAAEADLRIGRVADTRAPRRFEPASLRLRVPDLAAEPRFVADVAAAAGKVRARVTGGYDAARGVARADVRLPRPDLRGRPLPLAALSSRFEGIVLDSGGVEAAVSLRWRSAAGVAGTGTVAFDDATIDLFGTVIEGLTGRIALRDLLPPATAEAAALRARAIRAAIVFSDATVEASLDGGDGGSRLRIGRFEAGVMGGRVAVRDAVFDPFAPENEVAFRFEEIDVEELFALANLSGVSGTGRLSGAVPVAVRDDAVAVRRGELAARGGVLRIRSEAAASLLAGGGESARLLLDALRDFHYDELGVTIAKEFEGEAAVRLHLEGRNPNVLDGHPFDINVNLTGNLDHLVASLVEVARLSDRAVRATVGAVR